MIASRTEQMGEIPSILTLPIFSLGPLQISPITLAIMVSVFLVTFGVMLKISKEIRKAEKRIKK